MTTTLTVASDDSEIIKQVVDERPSTWWHLPVATTVLGLLALLFFGLRGLPGVESTFHLAREGDLNPLGIVPESVTVPSRAAAIVLAVLALAIAAALWALQSRHARVRPRVRAPLVVLFEVVRSEERRVRDAGGYGMVMGVEME